MTTEPPRNDHTQKIVRVDVRGDNMELWARLRPKLLAKIEQALDSVIDHERSSTVREELKQFTSSLLDFARRRLQREGLENDKIEAEIAELYAKRTKELSEADLISANADRVRQATAMRELCLQLALTRAMLIGDDSEEAIVFGQQMDAFLDTVRSLGLLQGG